MLYQLTAFWFPNWWAESYHTARMAQGFRDSGVSATLVQPADSDTIPWSLVPEVYGLREEPSRISLTPGRPPGGAAQWLLSRARLARLACRTRQGDVVLGRRPGSEPMRTVLRLKAASLVRATTVIEVHDADPVLVAAGHPGIDGYVTTHGRLQDFLHASGVSGDRILVAPNAVDLQFYLNAHREGRQALRDRLGLPGDSPVVCYSGRVSVERNVQLLVDAVGGLGRPVVLVIIGDGGAVDTGSLREAASGSGEVDLRVLGRQSSLITAQYQIAADVLVLPYGRAGAAKYSPIKLGEYLAAGPPIAAFRGPINDALLSDDDVVWAGEESGAALAEAIRLGLSRTPRTPAAITRLLASRCWSDRAREVAAFAARLRDREAWRS